MEYTKCWLDYPLIRQEDAPLTAASDFTGPVARSALEELERGFFGLYRRALARVDENADLTLRRNPRIHPEGYRVSASGGRCVVESGAEAGALYGVFALLRQLRLESRGLGELEWQEETAPANPLRMLNHWDNMDGNIERGYSGKSFFFADDRVLVTRRT